MSRSAISNVTIFDGSGSDSNPGSVLVEGIGFQLPKFLKRGDVMTIEIQGIGKLENEVVA